MKKKNDQDINSVPDKSTKKQPKRQTRRKPSTRSRRWNTQVIGRLFFTFVSVFAFAFIVIRGSNPPEFVIVIITAIVGYFFKK